MSKIIIFFAIVLLIFGGVIVYQYTKQAEVTDVTINEQTFKATVVTSPEDKQKGLSVKDSLGEDEAMLFVFENNAPHAFWMKEMKFPIDIIFIKDDTITSIAKNAPAPSSPEQTDLPIYRPTEPVNRVLEINAGLSDQYGFKPGDKVNYQLAEPTEAAQE